MKVFIIRTVSSKSAESHIYCLSVKFDFLKAFLQRCTKQVRLFQQLPSQERNSCIILHFHIHPEVFFWEGRGATNTMDTGENVNSSVTTLKLFEEEEIDNTFE